MSGDQNKLWLKHPKGLIQPGTLCPNCGRYNSRNSVAHALVIQDNKVLLVLRAQDPMSNYWAIPAGYVDWDETVEQASLRELKEETGYSGSNPRLFKIYSDPERDPDGRQNIAIVYLIDVIKEGASETPEEVLDVSWFSLEELPEKIAFDHRKIISDYFQTIK